MGERAKDEAAFTRLVRYAVDRGALANPRTVITLRAQGCTFGDVPIGDWKITIERDTPTEGSGS